jgi:hypothetical protein
MRKQLLDQDLKTHVYPVWIRTIEINSDALGKLGVFACLFGQRIMMGSLFERISLKTVLLQELSHGLDFMFIMVIHVDFYHIH